MTRFHSTRYYHQLILSVRMTMMRKLLLLLATGWMAAAHFALGASLYDYELNSINYDKLRLQDFKGKVLLIVNVASRCGYTPQYSGLQTLYLQHKDQGFVILGIPSNDFGQGEPGSDPEIKQFCKRRYDVTFPMSSKVSITGNNAIPLYEYLTDKSVNPKTGGRIHWNFTKFLISRDGTILARFEPAIAPEDPALVQAVESALR